MSPKRKKTMYLLYLGFLLLGLALTYFAVRDYRLTKELLRDGAQAEATVVEMLRTGSTKNGKAMTSPRFEYAAQNGELREFQSSTSSYPPEYEVGEKVIIVYDRMEAGKEKIMSFWGLYALPVILIMIASPFLVLGTAYLLYISK